MPVATKRHHPFVCNLQVFWHLKFNFLTATQDRKEVEIVTGQVEELFLKVSRELKHGTSTVHVGD